MLFLFIILFLLPPYITSKTTPEILAQLENFNLGQYCDNDNNLHEPSPSKYTEIATERNNIEEIFAISINDCTVRKTVNCLHESNLIIDLTAITKEMKYFQRQIDRLKRDIKYKNDNFINIRRRTIQIREKYKLWYNTNVKFHSKSNVLSISENGIINRLVDYIYSRFGILSKMYHKITITSLENVELKIQNDLESIKEQLKIVNLFLCQSERDSWRSSFIKMLVDT